MKKVIFVMLAAFLFTANTMAQHPINKGDFFVNASLSNFDLSFGDGTSFKMASYGGYFLIDKLALIGGIGLDTRKDYTSFDFSAGVRYYFLEQTKGSFFTSGTLDLTKVTDIDATVGMKFNLGYAFFIVPNVSLEPLINLWIPFSSDYDVTFSIAGGISVYF